jgi:hypothetical protein
MALLDYFSGYHQIWLRREDEEKTSFITLFGMYCNLRMLEGIRNADPTFCRMTKEALKDQVGRNMLPYVDDIDVASTKKSSFISDLVETFTNTRKAKLKLNPEKCVFRVTRGKVLGCLVSTNGIEANHDKIKAILQMHSLQTKKEVQKLTECIAALNKFIAKLAERSLPFFSMLRGSTKVEWGPKQQKPSMISRSTFSTCQYYQVQNRANLLYYTSSPNIRLSAEPCVTPHVSKPHDYVNHMFKRT